MLHGYGDTVGSCFKQKGVRLGGKRTNTVFMWTGWHVVFLLCCPFLVTFVTCLSSLRWSQQPIYSVTAHLTRPTHMPVHSSCAEVESFCSLTMPLHYWLDQSVTATSHMSFRQPAKFSQAVQRVETKLNSLSFPLINTFLVEQESVSWGC